MSDKVLRHEHYEQFKFVSIRVPLTDGTRTQIYFKRIPQAETGAKIGNDSIYSQIQKHVNFKKNLTQEPNSSSEKLDSGDIPYNRSLILLCFDHPIDESAMMKVFSQTGKVRRIFKGSFKVQNAGFKLEQEQQNKNKKVHIGIVVYRNEYDLVKCFDLETFQERINKKFMHIKYNEGGRTRYNEKIFKDFEQTDELRDQWVQEANEDGFEVVTDKHGGFNFNTTPKEPKKIAARKRKRDKTEDKNALYKYEVELREMQEAVGDDYRAKSAKELLKMKKQDLLDGFQMDKENLKAKKVKRQ